MLVKMNKDNIFVVVFSVLGVKLLIELVEEDILFDVLIVVWVRFNDVGVSRFVVVL